jgi:hypothetical protein
MRGRGAALGRGASRVQHTDGLWKACLHLAQAAVGLRWLGSTGGIHVHIALCWADCLRTQDACKLNVVHGGLVQALVWCFLVRSAYKDGCFCSRDRQTLQSVNPALCIVNPCKPLRYKAYVRVSCKTWLRHRLAAYVNW